jgi:beta-glucosidase
MGVAFVSAFEKMNIITTPKHFVANVGDGEEIATLFTGMKD